MWTGARQDPWSRASQGQELPLRLQREDERRQEREEADYFAHPGCWLRVKTVRLQDRASA
jgi:hypothetical protein